MPHAIAPASTHQQPAHNPLATRYHRRGPVVHLQVPRADDTAPPRPSISDVVRAAAAVSGVALERILGPSKSVDAVRPRHAAMYVAYEIARGASLMTVGHVVGRRDHITVLNAIHVTRLRMQHDPAVAEMVRLVRAVALDPSHPLPAREAPPPPPAPQPVLPDGALVARPEPPLPERPRPEVEFLSGERVRRARILRRRGWSVAGIARYLDADPAIVAVAVGEAPDECVPARLRQTRSSEVRS